MSSSSMRPPETGIVPAGLAPSTSWKPGSAPTEPRQQTELQGRWPRDPEGPDDCARPPPTRGAPDMQTHDIVSREEWQTARIAHLHKEKELTRARDVLHQERRSLPWVRVDKPYVFDGPSGAASLADLFGSHQQLIVQHFMF